MARYVTLIQFSDQGMRNIRETVKRGDAAAAEAEKNGNEDHRRILDDGRVRRSSRGRCAQ